MPRPLILGAPLRDITGRIRRHRSSRRTAPGVIRRLIQDALGSPSRSAGPSDDGPDAVDEVEGLGDVVDVGGGCDDVQWGAQPPGNQTPDLVSWMGMLRQTVDSYLAAVTLASLLMWA